MYAIIKTGGKQYRVAEGQILHVEMLDAEAGKEVLFSDVLMVADGDKFHTGLPLVKGAQVSAEVLSQGRGKKINIIKFRRRKHHMKQMGHRQNYTEIKVKKIKV